MEKYKILINQDLRNGTLTVQQHPNGEQCHTCGKPIPAENMFFRYASYDEQGTLLYGPIHFCNDACLKPYYISAALRTSRKLRSLRISDDLVEALIALAEQHKRSFNSEAAWALEQYIRQERKLQPMQYDSRDGNYHGTLPDGREIIVDGDVFAEQEQEGISEGDLQDPLVWENNADGEAIRIVKK